MSMALSAVMNLTGTFAAGMQKNLDAAKAMQKQVQGMSETIKNSKVGALGTSIASGMSMARDALGAAGLASAGFLKGCVDGAAKAQKANADLAQTIKSTGGAAGLTANQVSKMAAEFSKTTTFGAGAIKTGQNMLLTFTNIGKDVFPMATQAMLDLAQKMGGDPVNSSIQLGKALNDPTKGVTALTRVGVTFTEQQKKQIKAMQDTGNMAGAQKVILSELNKEFGGQAAAAAQTYEGRLKQLSNTMGSIKGSIGAVLLPYVQKIAEAFLSAAQTVQSLPKPVIEVIAKVLALTAVFGTLIGGMSLFHKISAMVVPQVGDISKMFTKLLGPIGLVMLVISGLTYAYVKNLGGFKDFADQAIKGVLTTFNALVTWTKAHWPEIQSIINKVTNEVVYVITNILVPTVKTIIMVISDVVNYVKAHWSEISTTIKKVFNTVKTDFDSFKKTLKDHETAIKNTAKVLGTVFGPALIKAGAEATAAGIKLAINFTTAVIDAGVKAVAASVQITVSFIGSLIKMAAQAVLSALAITGQLIVALANFVIGALVATGVIDAQTGAMLLNKVQIIGITAALVLHKIGMLASAGATGIMTAATGIFNAVLAANPIVATIAVLALLGLAIYEVVKHWQEICAWIEKAWNWLTTWNGTKAQDKSVTFTQTRVDDNQTITQKAAERAGKNALGTSYWGGGKTRINEGNRGEIIDLPSGSRVIPHDLSKKSIGSSITIAKLADTIVVREEADIDKIAAALARKLNDVAFNMA